MVSSSSDVTFGSVLFVFVCLLFVLLLIWLSRYALLYLKEGRIREVRIPRLFIEEGASLDSKRRIVVVRYGECRAMLLIGGANDIFIGWLTDSEREDSGKNDKAEEKKSSDLES